MSHRHNTVNSFPIESRASVTMCSGKISRLLSPFPGACEDLPFNHSSYLRLNLPLIRARPLAFRKAPSRRTLVDWARDFEEEQECQSHDSFTANEQFTELWDDEIYTNKPPLIVKHGKAANQEDRPQAWWLCHSRISLHWPCVDSQWPGVSQLASDYDDFINIEKPSSWTRGHSHRRWTKGNYLLSS